MFSFTGTIRLQPGHAPDNGNDDTFIYYVNANVAQRTREEIGTCETTLT